MNPQASAAELLGTEPREVADELSAAAVATPSPGRTRTRSVMFGLAAGWVALVLLSAVFADLLPLPAYDEAVGPSRLSPFRHISDGQLLGTDPFGRSNLSRAIYGARNSLLIGVAATFIGLAVGAFVGLAAGYLRGWTDRASSFVVDTMLAFPPLVLLLTISAVLRPSASTVLIALSLLVVPTFIRLERAAALAWAQRPFVLAARSYGTSEMRIAIRHVFPNSMLTLISFIPTVIAGLIVAEGSLSFLGLGIPSPEPSWGVMISEGRIALRTAPSVVFVPGTFVFLSVLSFNIIGEHVRARIESAGTDVNDGATPLLAVEALRSGIRTPRGTVRAVDGVTFTVERGQRVGVVGESGCGKTMLARSIMGLVPRGKVEREGSVRLDGQELLGRTRARMREVWGTQMSLVPQDPMTSLNPVRRIGDQLMEPLRHRLSLGKREARRRAIELLESFHIPDAEKRMREYPHQLSGGMRQRIVIAAAIACGPRLLFADEPTTALDVTIQAQILALLDRMRTERNMSIVLVTHNLGVVAHHTDEVIVMYAGRIVERAPTSVLFSDMRMPYTQALLAAIPAMDEPVHTRLAVIPGRPPDLVTPMVGCRFAPRCERVQADCRAEEPGLVAGDALGHEYRCWHPVDGPKLRRAAEPVAAREG